jgi:hypothetical protein
VAVSSTEELAQLAQRSSSQGDGASFVFGLLFLVVVVGAGVLLYLRYPQYRSGASDVIVVVAAVLLALFTLGYMFPSSIAIVRKVRNVGSILVINFLLGWTLIGWVVALAMAASSKPQPPPQTNVYIQQHQTTETSQPTQPPSELPSHPSEPRTAIPPPPPEPPD